ncbi:MAG: hypothetical protein V1835_00660 [Candidatus Micrarchaeota archaeon]
MGKYLGGLIAGQISRSEKTANAHRLFRDGNGPYEEFKRLAAEDIAAAIDAQNGFAYISGGQLDWLDVFRPIAHSFSGFEKRPTMGEDAIGPVTRWFRTNSFYRKPHVTAKIDCKGGELAHALPRITNGMVLLAGPYSFSEMVENSHYADKSELAMDYCKAISKNLHELKTQGYECVLLLEPAVGYHISKKSFEYPKWYPDAIAELKKSGLKLGIHFPLANAEDFLHHMDSTAADFIGIDCIYTRPEDVKTKKDLLFGVVDGARANVEEKEEIIAQVNRFLAKAQFSGNYYVGPNDRLFDVPHAIALEKLRTISTLKSELK